MPFAGLIRSAYFFFFKQKTAYEMRISDWSSDVCSSDLERGCPPVSAPRAPIPESAFRFEARGSLHGYRTATDPQAVRAAPADPAGGPERRGPLRRHRRPRQDFLRDIRA